MAEQEKILRESWLVPFEIPFGGKMDEFLIRFVETTLVDEGRHVSAMEATMVKQMKENPMF